MITVKEAAQKAIDYFNDLFKEVDYENIALEELELSPDESKWLITIGYSEPSITSVLVASVRLYKIFEIDAETGKVESMKIRKV